MLTCLLGYRLGKFLSGVADGEHDVIIKGRISFFKKIGLS